MGFNHFSPIFIYCETRIFQDLITVIHLIHLKRVGDYNVHYPVVVPEVMVSLVVIGLLMVFEDIILEAILINNKLYKR